MYEGRCHRAGTKIPGQLHLNRPFDQLFSRTPLLYSTATFAPMFTPSAVEGPRPLFRLISRAPIPPSHSSSPTEQFSSFSAPHLYRRIDFLPLCFHSLTNPSPRNPFVFTSIQNPQGITLRVPCLRGKSLVTNHKSRLFSNVQALYLSCASFSHSGPLFSMVCELFWKNTGVGGTA